MKPFIFAPVVIALFTPLAWASDLSSATAPLRLAEVVAQLESRYPGEVVAIQIDADGDKAPHYHVDMRFPGSGVARLDIDAVSLAMYARDLTAMPEGAVSLAEASALASAAIPGEVISTQLDRGPGARAHYDIDVRVSHGGIARITIDPATRQIGWRNPPVSLD